MPFIVAALGALAAVYFFVIRARNAAEMSNELLDVANDVRSAMRRFGFSRRQDQHPVDSIDDPNVARATIAVSYMELHGLPTEETRDALVRAIQSAWDVSAPEAEELTILGRWLMNECNGASPAIARTSKKLVKIDGTGNLDKLMTVLKSVSQDPLSDRQRDALGDIKTAFRIR